MNYKKDLKKVMILYPKIEVKSSKDYLHLINIHNILESAYKIVDPNMVAKAFENKDSLPLKTANDYFYLVTKTVAANKPLKKVAYPMMMGALSDEPGIEFDLDKWAGLVYKVYDAVNSGDMSLPNAIDYYSNTLNKESGERANFKRWIEYYNDGEHKKYNSDNNLIKKKADYQFPLNSSGFYPSDVFGDLLRPTDAVNEVISKKREPATSSDLFSGWKEKLHGAIRRIDKLLRQSDNLIDPDANRELADLLHNFDLEVRGLKLSSTASDRAFNVAKKLEKRGFSEGSEILLKYAQEVPTSVDEELDTGDIVPEIKSKEDISELTPNKPAISKDIEQEIDAPIGDLPGAEDNLLNALNPNRTEYYKDIEGHITLKDASSKLEEIASRLADRRTIRNLAEFDIMLDKIGIASMFPELSEAQSKLIDAYSYALTRVTKMLGMLSSGKNVDEISNARRRELVEKTMKDVNKTFEGEEESAAPAPIEAEFGKGNTEKTPATIQNTKSQQPV